MTSELDVPIGANLAHVLQQSRDPIYVANLLGEIVFANAAADKRNGDLLPRVADAIGRARQHRLTNRHDVHTSPIADGNGRQIGWLAIAAMG